MQRFLNALGPVTHILASILAVAWYTAAVGYVENLLSIALLCMVVALLPDVDTQASIFGRALPFISSPLERRYGHRQITHSLLALAVVAVIMFLLFPDAWLLLASAYASHLIIDMLVGHVGIPLFWPNQTRFHFARIRPASAGEGIIAFILAALIVISTLPRSAETVADVLPHPTATSTASPTPLPTPRLVHITVKNVYNIEDEILVRTGDSITAGQVVADLKTYRRIIATPIPTQTPPPSPTTISHVTPTPYPTPASLYLAELQNNRDLAHAYYQHAIATGTPDPNKQAAVPAYDLAIAEKVDCINNTEAGDWRNELCKKELHELEATAVSLLATSPPVDPLDVNIAYHQWQAAEIRYQQAVASLTPPVTLTPTSTPSPTQTPTATYTPTPSPNGLPNPDETIIVSIVSGKVHSIQVVSVAGNAAIVEIAILVPYNPALDPIPPTWTPAPTTNPTAEALGIPAVVVKVADGDTATFTLNGKEETARFIGVDTPETVHPDKPTQCYGPEASALTKEMLEKGSTVYLEIGEEERDRYGRLLAYVYLPDGRMLNELLLQGGYGEVLIIKPNDRYADRFQQAEDQAQAAGRGLWSACP
ncbi:MAG: hypothetical protein CSB13_01365 [Chloroflexi bacterium]|nr:MAG: hypothetical protein CSB13_01365 [Chloroflexota bacterium]